MAVLSCAGKAGLFARWKKVKHKAGLLARWKKVKQRDSHFRRADKLPNFQTLAIIYLQLAYKGKASQALH